MGMYEVAYRRKYPCTLCFSFLVFDLICGVKFLVEFCFEVSKKIYGLQREKLENLGKCKGKISDSFKIILMLKMKIVSGAKLF